MQPMHRDFERTINYQTIEIGGKWIDCTGVHVCGGDPWNGICPGISNGILVFAEGFPNGHKNYMIDFKHG